MFGLDSITVGIILALVGVGLLGLLLGGCAGSTGSYQSDPGLADFSESGKASYYAMKYQFRKTASGERFNQAALTGAHRTLPFGTRVRVTNVANDKSVTVRINDRGPFVEGRVIDLSRTAFSRIGNLASGIIEVRLDIVE